MQPETRYADADGVRIAFQTFGAGPPTIVSSAGSFSHTDTLWEDPGAALFYNRLASFSEVLRYDRLGIANSDPLPADWNTGVAGYVRELDIVLEAAGVDDVVLLGMLDAGPMAIHYAAERPDRVSHLVLFNATARFAQDVDYPIGYSPEAVDQMIDLLMATWGTKAQVAMNVPSRVGDERFAAWYAKYIRSIATPTSVRDVVRRVMRLDVRSDLARVRVPTLVVHRSDYGVVPADHGRYLAEHIPDARFEEIPGADGPMFWQFPDRMLDLLRSFLVASVVPVVTSQMATVLFTDIIGSTERAAEVGDREWAGLLSVHDEICDRVVAVHEGRVVKSTGDGILATFGDPTSAVRAALGLREELAAIGLPIRAGLHTGQVDDHGVDLSGIAVNVAARVMAVGGNEITASQTVRDLLLGTDFVFESRGRHPLKGVPGEWELFSVG